MRALLFALTLASALPCSAAIIAYDNQVSTGNQSVYPGSLGLDFDVNTTIDILCLGVYDSAADGLNRPITVYVYDRSTQTPLASLFFAVGNTGTLVNGQRFLPLAVPLTLSAGFQGSVVAENYGDGEPNLNNVLVSLPAMNDGGGAISFVGSARYGTAGLYPALLDGGPPNRYGAGTFEYMVSATAAPEPASAALMTTSLLGLVWLRRRSH